MDGSTHFENLLPQILNQHVEQVHKSLQWLAFGNELISQSRCKIDQHPLSLDQLAETSLVSPKAWSVDANCYICSAELEQLVDELIELEKAPREPWINDEQPVTTIRLKDAIREELLLESFRQGAASQFAFDEGQAKETIAITYLILLTSPTASDVEAKRIDKADKYILAQYAALYWIDFADTEVHLSTLQSLIRQLFLGEKSTFKEWTKLMVAAGNMYLNCEHSQLISNITNYSDKKTGEYAPPIVWAAAFNLAFIVRDLLAGGIQVNAARGGRGVTALYMAVHERHYEMASFLLHSGGDVADQYEEPTRKDHYYWSPSPLYLTYHHEYLREWTDLLLKAKDKIGRPCWRLEVGMELAARFGRLHCLEALVDAGADPNKGTGHEKSYGCPLQGVCDHGDEEAVRFLLEKGADPNTTGGQAMSIGHYRCLLTGAT